MCIRDSTAAEALVECCEFQVLSSDNKVWSIAASSADVRNIVHVHACTYMFIYVYILHLHVGKNNLSDGG